MKKIFLLSFMVVGIGAFAAHHEEEKVAAQGMISSDVFDLAGEMDLYVENMNLVVQQMEKNISIHMELLFMS